MASRMKSIFSVDVEDWFHILDLPSTPGISEWGSLPSRVEANFMKLLDIFSEHGAVTTCFFLGWVAERYPHLVREALARGHEIASHGYAHELVYEVGEERFLRDVTRAKKLIEDIAGCEVLGYRASGFSITGDVPWFFDQLARAGYRYDSSVFPAMRGHGGMKGVNLGPYPVSNRAGRIVEFPITVARVLGKTLCFFGGGYLRLFPYPVIRAMAQRVLGEGRPVIFYIHPREIDPSHPRLPMGIMRRFKSYVNLGATERKIRRILDEFELTTFRAFLEDSTSLRKDS